MSILKQNEIAILSLVFVCSLPVGLFAQVRDDYRVGTAVPTIASGADAQFDKRLPPVIPGEEVRDGNSRIKAWSTSGQLGSAPAAEPPRPPQAGTSQQIPLGVVVDSR